MPTLLSYKDYEMRCYIEVFFSYSLSYYLLFYELMLSISLLLVSLILDIIVLVFIKNKHQVPKGNVFQLEVVCLGPPQLDVPWMIEHYKQVLRLLPGINIRAVNPKPD